MTKSHYSRPSAEAELLTEEPVTLDEVVEQVGGSEHGAMVAFAGCVRASEGGRPIGAIDYEAYAEMAERQLRAILADARKFWSVRAAIRHRIGKVPEGKPSVVIACSAPHRQEAFEAAKYILERLKHDVPIWKVGYEWQ